DRQKQWLHFFPLFDTFHHFRARVFRRQAKKRDFFICNKDLSALSEKFFGRISFKNQPQKQW
ncbi:MAG: hypothetical protein ACM3SV_10820, partial [Betaproteobacteria bacterium]